MKRCPKCNRTYADDAFTFCLEDGALLSAPYDPEKKEEPISTIQSGGPPPTVVLRSEQDHEESSSGRPEERGPVPLAPTIAGPVAPAERQRVADSPGQTPRSRKRSKLMYAVPVVVFLLVGLGVGLGLFAYRQTRCWKMTVACKPVPNFFGTNYTSCELYGDLWGHHDKLALSDVKWTLSAGKILKSEGGVILIDTQEASERRIDVKATFSGLSSPNPISSYLCEYSASSSFVAPRSLSIESR
jgi:hypothetical protein